MIRIGTIADQLHYRLNRAGLSVSVEHSDTTVYLELHTLTCLSIMPGEHLTWSFMNPLLDEVLHILFLEITKEVL